MDAKTVILLENFLNWF